MFFGDNQKISKNYSEKDKRNGARPMSYLEEVLPKFRKGAKIRRKDWDYETYLVFDKKEEIIIDQEGRVCEFIPDDVVSDKWELYQEPVDWDYIIKNKCLCWFWDGLNKKIINTLTWFEKGYTFPYKSSDGIEYQNCRPVRRDEVTFYEDKNNE